MNERSSPVTSELLPCPFCGAEAGHFSEIERHIDEGFYSKEEIANLRASQKDTGGDAVAGEAKAYFADWLEERDPDRDGDISFAVTPAQRDMIVAALRSPGEAAKAQEPVLWLAWHPEKGYAPQTCGHDQQRAASLLMRTGIAGEHGWSVQPLYAGAAQPSQDEMENYRLALAWIKGQSTDPQAKEIAATALDASSMSSTDLGGDK